MLGQRLVDERGERGIVGDLTQPLALGDGFRPLAGLHHDGEDLPGRRVADDAVADEVEQPGEVRGPDREPGDAACDIRLDAGVLGHAHPAVERGAHLPHDPVGGRLRVSVLPLDALEILGQRRTRGQYLDVVVAQSQRGKSRAPRGRQLRHLVLHHRAPGGVEHQRRQIRLGKIAVVVTALLRATRADRAGRRVPEHGLLQHRLAALQLRALPRELQLERPLDAGEGVHVLDLGLGAERRLARLAGADVGVDTQAALLHAHVTHVEVLEQLLQGAEIGRGFRRRANVGLAHDLDQWHAGAVQVDGRRAVVAVVDGFARVLLEVDTRDADAQR